MDRIELGTQSLAEYRNFADDGEDVQATENTHVLITKLTSTAPADTLIVSSIQKMSNIFEAVDDEGMAINSNDIEKSAPSAWCLLLMRLTALPLAIC